MLFLNRSLIIVSFVVLTKVMNAQVNYAAWWIGMKAGMFSYTPFQYSFVETAGKGSPLALTGYINDQYKYKNWNLGIELIKPYYSIMVQTSNPIKSSVLEKDPWNYKLSNNNFLDMRFAAGPSMWHHKLSFQLGVQVNGFRNASFTTTGLGRAAYTSTGNVEGLN